MSESVLSDGRAKSGGEVSTAWVVESMNEHDDETQEPLYWHNLDGWVSRDGGTWVPA